MEARIQVRVGTEDPRLEMARSGGWCVAEEFQGHPKTAQWARDCLEERAESLLVTGGAGYAKDIPEG